MLNMGNIPPLKRGTMGSDIDLPNTTRSWAWGKSLGIYSNHDGPTSSGDRHTDIGKKINRFKYHNNIDQVERDSIVNYFSNEVFRAVTTGLAKEYLLAPPFNVCLGPPENRKTGHSLPKYICRNLAEEHDWIINGFESINKTRVGAVMKNLPWLERSSKLKGLYEIDLSPLPVDVSGFLIVDDVYETGSTLAELCDTIELQFPGTPRFVISLSHLHATKRSTN